MAAFVYLGLQLPEMAAWWQESPSSIHEPRTATVSYPENGKPLDILQAGRFSPHTIARRHTKIRPLAKRSQSGQTRRVLW
jgi:hypothetical protein